MKKGTAILLVVGILVISLGTIGLVTISTSSISNTMNSLIQQLQTISKYTEKTLGFFGFKSNYDLYILEDLYSDEIYFFMISDSNLTHSNLGRYNHYSYKNYKEPVSVGLTNYPVSLICDFKVDMVQYYCYVQSYTGEIYSFQFKPTGLGLTASFYKPNQTYNECIKKINDSGYLNNSLYLSVYELIGTEVERSTGGGGPF